MSGDPLVNAAWEKLERLLEKYRASSDSDVKEGLELTIRDLAASLAGKDMDPPQWAVSAPELAAFEFKQASLDIEIATEPGRVASSSTKTDSNCSATGDFPAELQPGLEEESPAERVRKVEEAENLLRQANVAKMRGSAKEAYDLLVKAADAAPFSSPVLEALGDELSKQRKFKEAGEMYHRAHKADPKNISAERKHAELIFNTAEAMTVLDSASDTEVVATSKAAALLSLIVPGAGQFVQFEWVKGGVYLVLATVFWVIAGQNGLFNVFAAMGLQQGMPNISPMAFFGIGAALITHFVSSVEAGSRGKIYAKKKIDRPTPPVNLPFD